MEGGILRTAGVYSEMYFFGSTEQMEDPHLLIGLAVHGVLDAEITFPAAEAVADGFYFCRYVGGRPVGIAQIRYYTP